MPKYLFQATYYAEGVKGLEKDKASGRKAALSNAIEGLGGKLEAFYLCFGKHDWVLLADFPDNSSATFFACRVRVRPPANDDNASRDCGRNGYGVPEEGPFSGSRSVHCRLI